MRLSILALLLSVGCDGPKNTDDSAAVTVDVDGDGYDATVDCADEDAAIHPDADETCDDADNDCDGLVDDADGSLVADMYYLDADEDGFGNADAGLAACAAPDGFVTDATDCDDHLAGVYPGADELCDGWDDDCDGETDEADAIDAVSMWSDADGDGYGAGEPSAACEGVDGWAFADGDCNDADPGVNPGAVEVCGGGDEDCDGLADDGDPGSTGSVAYYADADGDGYGDDASLAYGCAPPPDAATVGGDCNDGDAAVNPGATEVCGGTDDDCDGFVDDDDVVADRPIRYIDGDLDGHGSSALTVERCAVGSGLSAVDDDCDDGNPEIYPGRAEICDEVDQNCDGTVDEAAIDASTWFDDTDGDRWGDSLRTTVACDEPAGTTTVDGDCDDADATAYPFAEETCGDTIDQDCMGGDRQCPFGASVRIGDVGATWWGETMDDRAGHSIAGGGDTDGDGLTEVALGAYREDSLYGRAGAVYLIDHTGGILNTARAKIRGENAGDHLGNSVTFPGDVDADGYDDILIGAYLGSTSFAGAAYLMSGPVSGVVSVSTATAKLEGVNPDDEAGTRVGAAGDIDDDGVPDILVGAPNNDEGGYDDAGSAYLFYGPVSGTMSVDLADARFYGGEATEHAGTALSGGDLDADGIDDLIIGSSGATPNGAASGTTFVFYGPVSGDHDLADADSLLLGADVGHQAGFAADYTGDTDGDGYGDILIGAQGASYSGADAGGGYLVNGPMSGEIDLSLADAIFYGEHSGDQAGYDVSTAGDVDGDGRDDMLIGAWAEDETDTTSGATYLLLGPMRGTSSLGDAYAKLICNTGGTESGRSVAGAGDMDGDGKADIAIGAPDLSTYANGAGGAYILYASELEAVYAP